MWRNGLSLNKKPSDDMNETERAGGWVCLLSDFATVAAPMRFCFRETAQWSRGSLDEFGSTEFTAMTLVPR
jgi:hypothetical protein